MAAKGPQQLSWPVDPETGEPMAIVTAFTSEHVGSGAGIPEYCGIDIGPVGAMVPVKNDPKAIQEAEAEYLRLAQYVVGSSRRQVMWLQDPSTRPADLAELPQEHAEEKVR